MKLITLLYDIVEVIGCAPTMNQIRITPIDGGAEIKAMAEGNSKIGQFAMTGKVVEPIAGLNYTLGIPRVDEVKRVFRSPYFNRLTAKAEIQPNLISNDHDILHLTNEKEQLYKLALFKGVYLDDRIKQFNLKSGITYDVHLTPSESGLDVMNCWLEAAYDNLTTPPEFIPITRNGKMIFKTSAPPVYDIEYAFAEGITGQLKAPWIYGCQAVYSLCSLFRTTKKTAVSFGDMGVCRIHIQTSCAEYDFILPPIALGPTQH